MQAAPGWRHQHTCQCYQLPCRYASRRMISITDLRGHPVLGGKRPDDGIAADPHLTAHLALRTDDPSAGGGETISMSTAAKESWNTACFPTMLPCSATAD